MPDHATLLRVTEIFHSLQGESTRAGVPTVFVRLTGCPLRCGYCDSEYAFHGGVSMEIDEILQAVKEYDCPVVCVTGGEPLAQKHCLTLLTALCDGGYSVSLETSGALPIGAVDPRVARIVDIKTPGSGEADKNLWENLALLTPHDELKLVICHEGDYLWARSVVMENQLYQRCPVLFSPMVGGIGAADLADRVLADRLPVRFQMQLHKLLWGNVAGK